MLAAALGVLASAAFVVDSVRAQTAAPTGAAVDVTRLGPQVGDKAPNFTLADQRGQPRTLASLMGPNGLVLTFNRSADW
jgi:cytochrome oxidase Cu insertion factor (SCO1/SenC/PrrC family)